MADRVYNLTQTGAEVQDIINDADNAKGAGATTSLTTDYIMLKDTNGQYHKIQKDSFTEAVRNTLASLLVNNDKGTTISQIAAIASGDFGSVTPANLASVLGDTVSYNGEMNNLKKSGVFDCTSASGNPFGQNYTCIVFSTYVKGNILLQRAYRNNRAKMRWLWDTSSQGDWTDWTEIYGSYMLNNSEILSPLASALGGGSLIGVQPPTDAFGQSDGEYRDVTVSYGILLVRNYGTGETSVYSVGDGTSHLIYPSTQNPSFTVSRIDSSHVRITKVGNASYNALRAKVIDCG